MPTQITINGITGATPFNTYLCDNPITTCVYINTISSFPYEFQIPSILDGQNDYNLKVIDNNGCISFKILTI
jgi:hypothetical protein